MEYSVCLAGPADAGLFASVHDDVFDGPVDPALLKEYLADPHQHIAVAVVDGVIVGMASGVIYHHPDKPRELFLNEVGVAGPYRRRGIASALLRALLDLAWSLNCSDAWVLTEGDNTPALGLYTALGGTREGHDVVMFTFYPTGTD